MTLTTKEEVRRYRQPKKVTLSEEVIGYVSEYAKTLGLSFSMATELLLLRSLENEKAHEMGLALLIGHTVRREATFHYNRLAKLIAYAGLEAGAAKEAAQQLVFIKLLETARELPQVELLDGRLSVNPDSPAGKQIVSSYKRRQETFRTRAVKTMKKPIPELWEILEEYEKSQVVLTEVVVCPEPVACPELVEAEAVESGGGEDE